MILDLDSHLREGYFMDEVYHLEGEYAKYTPVRLGSGKFQDAKFRTNIPSLDETPEYARKAFRHPEIYHPKTARLGATIPERQAAGYDMERRLKDIEQERLDAEILFPTAISIPATAPGGLGAALSRAYNNWVAGLVHGHEDRLWPVAIAPAGCPEAMADELRRSVKDLGFKAGHLVPYVGERNLDDPVFYPYYAAAQEINVPLFCHPNTLGVLTNRFKTFFPLHVLGRPMNCTPALVALVCGGIFEKFPRLRVAFFECTAEWLVYWMHRMDDDYDWAQQGYATELTMAPSEYIKRNVWVTCEADEKRLAVAVDELGEDRICMATDFPHFDSEYPHTVSGIQERGDLTGRQKELILGRNAERLLNVA